jgi:hypothetical protein
MIGGCEEFLPGPTGVQGPNVRHGGRGAGDVQPGHAGG